MKFTNGERITYGNLNFILTAYVSSEPLEFADKNIVSTIVKVFAFASSDTVESGVVSSIPTNTATTLNEPFGVLTTDTVFTVASATGITNGCLLYTSPSPRDS